MKSRFLQGSTLVAALFAASMIATPASAKARHNADRDALPWHGWGQSFHYNGVRYPGGNRHGPKASYNNWEGGFHPTVFFMIREAERT